MLWLVDPQFQQAYPVMPILAVGSRRAPRSGQPIWCSTCWGQGAASARLLICSALLSVALSATLVPAFGLAGAATAASLALVAAAAGNCALARRRLELRTAIWHSFVQPWRAVAGRLNLGAGRVT